VVAVLQYVTGFNSVPKYRSPRVISLNMDNSKIDVASNNIPFERIVNMRDVASACPSKLVAGKIYRTGCVSNASESDIDKLHDFGINVWLDLRSELEHHEDENLNSKIYEGFQSLRYQKGSSEFKVDDSSANPDGKKRYFISLMNESLLKKGVFFRLRKRSRLTAVAFGLFSKVSRRANKKMRDIFINYINDGGLQLLNELVVDISGKEISEVLKVITKEAESNSVGMFCTAGKFLIS